ncbi:polyketide synthase-nonribosomal peptide synthetase hybrid himA-like [Pecten maximus]|uniref:polyketide synthase-nonribosomal peptide synthetase hybrid himA-like n=1 Tax=Pecten maximus TaxID=6579 RepID=UPI0014589700|nr:polyketide synthase-nonribosomal peptide synthetase hybrid himA-like [Pecten maximus]
MVSPTGQCQAFSDKADGYARGEGCGIVMLKTKRQALIDGNKIWAAIATGCNQDGRTTTPITAPSSVQQRNLLVKVYSETGINPKDIQYIEAHGTGTPVGDPIETNTLGQFFANKLPDDDNHLDSILLGSVKTNIGHLESAAGAAGLIKVLLMMTQGKIVPSLHFENPNPNIDFDSYRLEVARKMSPWPCHKQGGRLSCVNSFGFGGTNSHAVIKQYPDRNIRNHVKTSKGKHIIAVSGSDITSLGKNLTHLKQNIHKAKYCIEDVSYTSTCRRDHYSYRVALHVETKEEVVSMCNEQLQQLPSIKPPGFSRPNIVFVFCGVGTTWTGMCQEMMKKEDIFKDAVRNIDNILTPLAGWSIFQTLTDGFDITDPLKSHLAIFTCQVALTKLWNHFGIQPDIIVGQSVGEVAAAYAAGALTLEDAVRVIYERSFLLAKATGGTMCVVGNCYVSIVAAVCKKFQGKVSIAVHSSAKACTISGDKDAIEEFIQILEKKSKENILIRPLDVQCAYHSHYTKAASEQLETSLLGLRGVKPKCELISTVTGGKAETNDFVSPGYWAKNVRQPVLFQQAITKAQLDKTFNIYLEIGPKPVLRFHLGDIVGNSNATALPSMTEKKKWEMVRLSLMELYKHGVDLHWKNIVTTGHLTDIPKCLFNQVKLLFESDVTSLKYSGVQTTQSNHLFVERAGGDDIQFKINISPNTTWFLYEHVVSGTIMVPGAFYIDVAMAVCKELVKNKSQKNLSIAAQFLQPLRLSKGEACKAEASVDQFEDELSIYIRKNKETVAKCQITDIKEMSLETVDVEAIRRRCTVRQSASQTYQNLKRLGFAYGNDLQILGDSIKSDDECLVQMTLSDAIFKNIDSTNLHPSILDGLLQTPGVLNVKVNFGTTLLPGGIESIIIRQPPERNMLAFASLVSQTKEKIQYNALLLTEDGRVIAEVRNFFILCIGTNHRDDEDCMYQNHWEELEMKASLTDSLNSNDEPHKSIVISLDRKDAEILDSEISQMSISHILTQGKNLQNTLTQHLQIPDQFQSIIFSVGKVENLDLLTGQEVMQNASENVSTLLHVCQLLVKLKTKLHVLIITEQTQRIDTSHNSVDNIIGSELWGMARTIVREFPLQLTLIDRHVPLRLCSSTITELLVHQNPQLCSEAELLVTRNKVYSNQMVRQQKEPGEYKWISLSAFDRIHLKSYHPDDVNEKFCLLQDDESLPKGLLMEVETAVLHDKTMFSLTTQSAENDIPIWETSKEDGFDIITFEICGKVTSQLDENAPPKQLEGLYAACSQFTLQSIVKVPKECMLRIDDLPSYKPGLLLTSTLLWQMKQYFVKGKSLIVSDGDDTSGLMLRSMLSKPLASQVTFTTLNSLKKSDSHQFNADIVVILTAVDFVAIDSLLNKIKGVNACYSLEMFGGMKVWQTAKKRHKAILFNILRNEEILNPEVLLETIPKVVKWLRRKIPKINSSDIGSTTGTVVQLKSAKQEGMRVKSKMQQLFRRNSCYIIVGGLTGLGWEILKYLAAAGAGKIVTISRSHPNAAKVREITKLEKATSTSIKAMSADITNIRSLEKVFARIDGEFGRHSVKGIFHGGAVLNDGLFTKQTDADFRKVLLPKVLGSWNLHVLSNRYDLDFFILHSSMTSIFGNKGQSNYSAGNAFMDSLAHYRAAKGLPALSINWGPLAVGMATDNSLQEELERIGYMFLDVRKITDTLMKMLMSEGNQIVAGIFDWSLVDRQFSDKSMERVRRRFRRVMGNDNGRRMQAISEEIIGNHDLDTNEGITSFVTDVASRVFAVDADMINSSTSLMNLGIDSMVAMTFVNTINNATGCTIPIVLLLSEETNIGKVVDYIEANIKRTNDVESSHNDSTVTDDLTHMEKDYFQYMIDNAEALSLFIYCDFEATGIFADETLWRANLTHVVQKHSALRTRFVHNTDGHASNVYTRLVEPAEQTKIDFRVVTKGTIDRNERIPSDLALYRFLPEADLPLRYIFENRNGTSFIRMVFSHLTFDMASILIVLEDIKNFSINSEVPVQVSAPPQDIARQVKERLREQETALETYWRNKIPKQLSPLSLAGADSYHFEDKDISTTTDKIPKELVMKLVQFCRNHETTPYQLMMTAYQMVLHLVTGAETVCVLTLADMRMHFPEFQREIGCLVNTVPLFCTFPRDGTISNILAENGKEIRMILNSSLYPFSQIVKEVGTRQVEPDSVLRHMLIYRDFQKENTKENEGYVNLLNMVSPNHMYETMLAVMNDRKNTHMSLELEYNTLAITKSKAESLLQMFVNVIEYLIDHTDSTMQGMTSVINRAPLESTQPVYLNSGEFIKQTRNGWNHAVQLSVCRKKDGNRFQTILKWSKPNSQQSRDLNGKDIESVDRAVCNGLQTLLVRTRKRVFTFMTPNKRLCDEITDGLLDGLERARNGHPDTSL